MKQGTFLSVLFVIALISFDITLSVAYAKPTTTVYKVTKISSGGKLRLRAWPSSKSRIKISLPHNAKNITTTGKSKVVSKIKWKEVKWKGTRGWVIARHLKKTGSQVKSRNKVSKSKRTPQEFRGDRYDQTIEARGMKTSHVPKKNKIRRNLSCSGNTPKPWNMKLNLNGNKMSIRFPGRKALTVPLSYNEWTSTNKSRINLGGSRGRNTVVDVNLERTNSCRINSRKGKYVFEIKTTINNRFYSGCCR